MAQMRAIWHCEIFDTTGLLRDGTERRRIHVHQPARLDDSDERRDRRDVHRQDQLSAASANQPLDSTIRRAQATGRQRVIANSHRPTPTRLDRRVVSCRAV